MGKSEPDSQPAVGALILNAYAVVDASLCGLRLLLGATLAVTAIGLWQSARHAASPGARTRLENRAYLVSLFGLVLAGLNLASWPLFYAVLQSYVPQWQGVMCIQGVAQIGSDSGGTSGMLPRLIRAIELLKPAAVFAAGAWSIVYLLNRREASGALLRPTIAGAAILGLFTGTDAVTESAYLLIPKRDESLARGCCTATPSGSRAIEASASPSSREVNGGFIAGHVGLQLGTAIVLLLSARRLARTGSMWYLPLIIMASALALIGGISFLTDAAAPWMLGLPGHRCLYCLFWRAPESGVAAMLLISSTFSVGWAVVARLAAGGTELAGTRAALVGGLLNAAWWCQTGFVAMVALEMALAA